MAVKVKLCGFTNQKTLTVAANSGVDFIGFVFAQNSPRNIAPKKAGEIAAFLPKNIYKVAVLCDADDNIIKEIISHLKPHFLQLHGNETPKRIKEIKDKFQIKIIKAFKIENESDLAKIGDFEEIADLLMFDAKNPGSGKAFDWKILQNIKTNKNWFLSGGININNIDQALEISGAKMVDLSSGIEEIKGQKSAKLIEEFMKKIN